MAKSSAESIRRCGPDDAAALALVGAATFLDSYAWMIEGRDILAHVAARHSEAAYAAFLANPACALWLAESALAAPIGFALLTAPDLPVETAPDDLEVRRIYLLSRYQGSGLGRALLDAAIGEARTRGAARLLLGTATGNDRAIGFYRHVGFNVVGERQFTVGARTYDDWVLALTL